MRSVRQTRTRGVLLELKKISAEARALFAKILKKAAGDTSNITELVLKATLEIRDCDCCTSAAEVEKALKRTLPDYKGKAEIRLTNPNARH